MNKYMYWLMAAGGVWLLFLVFLLLRWFFVRPRAHVTKEDVVACLNTSVPRCVSRIVQDLQFGRTGQGPVLYRDVLSHLATLNQEGVAEHCEDGEKWLLTAHGAQLQERQAA